MINERTITLKIILLIIALVFIIPLSLRSCKRVEDRTNNVPLDTPGKVEDTSQTLQSNDIKVNIYIESSGSMDGFVEGSTNFKHDIGDLLVDVKYYYDEENVKLYFIHNDFREKLKMRTIEKELANFADWIDVDWKNEPRGCNTKLNNIFDTILRKTDANTVSILISDCIYSIGNGETKNSLFSARSQTKDAFLSRIKKRDIKLATSIYRMLSEFNGKYYPYTGDAHSFKVNDKSLPYYICVFADNNVMYDFYSKIKISDCKGYNKKYTLAHSSSEEPYWTILPVTNKKGRFQRIREHNSVNAVHGIENVEHDKDGLFSFCVAIDMSGINVQEDYLLDPSNYILDNYRYKITTITPYNKEDLNSSDLVIIQKSTKNPTHIITIEATGTAVCDLELSLERKMPHWIDQYNIMDDTKCDSIESGGSFGLRYWIEGISEAYEIIYPGDNTYFSFKITIKK